MLKGMNKYLLNLRKEWAENEINLKNALKNYNLKNKNVHMQLGETHVSYIIIDKKDERHFEAIQIRYPNTFKLIIKKYIGF